MTDRTTPARPTTLAAGGLLLGAGLVTGLLLTHTGAAHTGELRVDVGLSHDREWPLVDLARLVQLALGPVIGLVLVAIGCAVVWSRWRAGALALAVGTAAGWLATGALKGVVARPRPPVASVHPLLLETARDSYPSGHTALAASFVVAAAVVRRAAGHRTRRVWLVGLPCVAVVAASRLYLGVHYLGDVLASVVVSAGTVLVLSALCGPWLSRHAPAGDATRALTSAPDPR